MTDSAIALRRLGIVLAAKLALVSATVGTVRLDVVTVTTATLAIAALLGLWRERSWGHAALCSALLLRVTTTFPHTLNHAYFELLVAVVLWRTATRSGPKASVHARLLLQFAMLSVFFYSGVQKLVRGEFLTGEYLLRTLALESGPLTRGLRWALDWAEPLPSLEFPALLLHPVAVSVPIELHAAVVATAVGIVAAELVVPMLVVLRVRGARWILLTMQIGIGLGSGEVDFAMSATAMVLLFWRRTPRWTWFACVAGWTVVGVMIL